MTSSSRLWPYTGSRRGVRRTAAVHGNAGTSSARRSRGRYTSFRGWPGNVPSRWSSNWTTPSKCYSSPTRHSSPDGLRPSSTGKGPVATHGRGTPTTRRTSTLRPLATNYSTTRDSFLGGSRRKGSYFAASSRWSTQRNVGSYGCAGTAVTSTT